MLKFHAVERLIHPQTEHAFSMVNENLILFVKSKKSCMIYLLPSDVKIQSNVSCMGKHTLTRHVELN